MSSEDLILSRHFSELPHPVSTIIISLLICCMELMIVLLSSFLNHENEFDLNLLLAASSVASSVQLLDFNRKAGVKMLLLLKLNAMCRTRTHVLSSALLGRAEDITPPGCDCQLLLISLLFFFLSSFLIVCYLHLLIYSKFITFIL